MSSDPVDIPSPPPAQPAAAPEPVPAPARDVHVFWRRVAALLLDTLLLGILGAIAGWPLFDWFASLGSAGRLVGFGVAWVYFGILNSAIGGGQTVGKRIMGLEVVDHAGRHVTLRRSGVRYFILGVPFFLNGAINSPSWIGYLAGFVIFAGGGSIIYLFLFNRRTRQSLHDLICGTFVTRRAPEGGVQTLPVWRLHLAIVVALFVTVLGIACLAPSLAGAWKFPGLIATREKILATDAFSDAGVFVGKNWSFRDGVRGETKYLAVSVRLKHRPGDYEPIAHQVALIALANYPESQDQDVISVTVSYGYDIGIARTWITHTFQHTPEQWAQFTGTAK